MLFVEVKLDLERRQLGSDGVGGGREDCEAGGALQMEIHDMAIGRVAVSGIVRGLGARDCD